MRKQINKKGTKRKAKPLPIEVDVYEFTKIMDKTRSMHHKVAFLLAWGSGLRISEVLNLKPGDFNFVDETIRINMGKNSKDRIVPIPKGFEKDVHLKYIPISCGVRALQKAFILYAEKAGVKDYKAKVHFHSLRHGFATQCLRSDMKLPSIQMLLGHEDLSTTAIYTNLVPKEATDDYKENFLVAK